MSQDTTSSTLGYSAGALMDEALQLLDNAGLALPAAQLASAIATLDAVMLSIDASVAVACLTTERQAAISIMAD